MRIPLDGEVVDQGLLTLGDLKCDVNVWLSINNVRIDFDILITAILVKRSYVAHALMQKFVAKLSSGEHRPATFHRNLFEQVARIDMLVATKRNLLDLVARTSVYVVDQVNVGVLILEIRGYFRIEVALALEKIDQISPPFFHQIGINGSFGE